MNDALLQAFLQVLIQVLVPILVGFAIAGITAGVKYIQSKMSESQLAYVKALVNTFVLAAEQNGLTGALKEEGEVKKAWVIEQTKAALEAKGVHIDVQLLANMIEAAVHENWKLPTLAKG